MAVLDVSVSRYSLTVDTVETIGVMVESADNPWGRRLHDALEFAMVPGAGNFVVSPYVRVDEADVCPDRSALPEIEGRCVSDVLDKLQAAGYLTATYVLRETSSEGYLSDGRTVTAVHVLRPFALVGVEYRWTREARGRVELDRLTFADSWEITDRSYIVPAGWYLVGEVGDYRTELEGVAGMDSDPEGWLFELDGFGATVCAAHCAACGGDWIAEAGSWRFRTNGGDEESWNFDDVEDFNDDGTIACPSCPTGRVGFDIY